MNLCKKYFYFHVFIILILINSCSTYDKKQSRVTDSFYNTGVVIEKEIRGSYFRSTISPLFRVYDKFISPVDNKKCIFTPTCSAYSRQAFQKYGFSKGYILTFARITRCNPSVFIKNRYPHLKENDIWKAYDPLK